MPTVAYLNREYVWLATAGAVPREEVAAHAATITSQANSQAATVVASINVDSSLSALRTRIEAAMAE